MRGCQETTSLDEFHISLEENLKAKSGFSSYAEYLRKNLSDHPEFSILLRVFEQRAYRFATRIDSTVSQYLSIIDAVKVGGGWSLIRRPVRLGPSANAAVDALHDSLHDVSLRIFVWHLDREWRGLGLVDTLGLLFRLDPRFFAALLTKVSPGESDTELRPLYATHLLIGNSVVTFGRLGPQCDSVPFVLIAGDSAGGHSISRGMSPTKLHQYSFHQDLCEVPSFDISISDPPRLTLQESGAAPIFEGDTEGLVKDWISWYIDILSRLLSNQRAPIDDSDSLSLASLFPVLQLTSLGVRDWSRSIRSAIESPFPTTDESKIDGLYLGRMALRRWLEDTDDNMEHLRRYALLHHKPALLTDPFFQHLEHESRQMVAQARRLENEVRDWLQIHAGAEAP